MPRPRARFVIRPLFLPVGSPALPPPSLADPNVKIDEAWIEIDLGEAWTAAYRINAQDGTPVIAELRVYPREPDNSPGQWRGAGLGTTAPVPRGGLTARLLRQLRPGNTRGSDLQEGLADWRRHVLGASTAALFTVKNAGFHRLTRRPRLGGRRGWSDETLVRAAAFYVDTGGQHPVKDLAAAWKLKDHAQARDLLQAARKKGFLSPGRLGVTSRALTDKARAHLAALAKETKS